MKRIHFYGSSDDLVEVEGDISGCDEYNTGDGWFNVAGLNVGVILVKGGVWAIEVSQIDEDVPVTASHMLLTAEGYSMHLRMNVPDGSYVRKYNAS